MVYSSGSFTKVVALEVHSLLLLHPFTNPTTHLPRSDYSVCQHRAHTFFTFDAFGVLKLPLAPCRDPESLLNDASWKFPRDFCFQSLLKLELYPRYQE